MASKPLYQAYIDLIEELGGEVKFSNEGKKHVKIYFTKPGSSKEQFFIASKTPSDHRSLDNAKSTIRRLLSLGAEETQQPVEDDEEDELTFGQKLRTLREQKQLSRAKLAELAGINTELVEFFETIPRQPFLEHSMMLKLSTALGTTLSYLTEGEVMEGEPVSELAQRVRQRRDELNLTIGALAARTGIPPDQLSNIEVSAYTDFYRMPDLAAGLGVTEEFLRTGEKEETPAAILNPTEQEEALNKISTAKELGLYLQDRRIKLDISQLQMGNALGQNYPTEVSKMERGLGPRLAQRHAAKFATVLQLPVDALQAAADRVTPDLKRRPTNAKPPNVKRRVPEDSNAERRKRLVEQVIIDHTRPPAENEELANVLAAIRVEGRLTRELLQQQHQELVEIVKEIQSESVKDMLHGLINNLFKRG